MGKTIFTKSILYTTLKCIYILVLQVRTIIIIQFARLFPIRKDIVVFESNPDLSDNSYAMFHYLYTHGFQGKYRLCWLIRDKRKIGLFNLKNITYLKAGTVKEIFMLQRAKFVFFDHSNLLSGVRRKNQVSIALWHGTPIKGPKSNIPKGSKTWPTYVTATSELACKFTAQFCFVPEKIVKPWGYPRNDYLFNLDNIKRERIAHRFEYNKYNKVILWMPTFRQSFDTFLSEDYMNNETGLPLTNTEKELNEFNDFLRLHNILIMLKLHPLQAKMPIFSKTFSNILIVRNTDLEYLGVQLYEYLATSDALITDYSSISTDYLLLNRPIIFTTSDYEDYKHSRGFIVENILDYLPGPHVNNMSEFQEALRNITSNNDLYVEKRKEVTKLFHKNPDGNSAKRIAEKVGITQ